MGDLQSTLDRLLGWAWVVGGGLLLGLPVMLAISLWQGRLARQADDEPLACAWYDAARSFGGMLVAALVLMVAGQVAWAWLLERLAALQTGG